MTCKSQFGCDREFISILRQALKSPSEYSQSVDWRNPRVPKPLGDFRLAVRRGKPSGPKRFTSLCGVNNPLNLNRYRRQESLESARGQKTPRFGYGTKRTAFRVLLDGCGFDPEQFVGASVTRGFWGSMFSNPLSPPSFFPFYWGEKEGGFWNVLKKCLSRQGLAVRIVLAVPI